MPLASRFLFWTVYTFVEFSFVQEFTDAIASRGAPKCFEDVLQYVPEFRRLALHPNFASDVLNGLLERSIADPEFAPAFFGRNGIIVASSIEEKWMLTMMLGPAIAEPARIINGMTQHMLLSVLSDARVTIRRYKQDGESLTVLDRRKTLRPNGKEDLRPRDVYAFQAGVDAYNVVYSDPVVLLRFNTGDDAPFVWQYDAQTLAPIRTIGSNLHASRVQFALQALALLGTAEHARTAADLFDHPAHYVRWEAVKAAFALDFDAGMELLMRAKDDLHPHVRNAAVKSIERYSQLTLSGEA